MLAYDTNKIPVVWGRMINVDDQVIRVKAKPWDPALKIGFIDPTAVSSCSSLSPPPDCPAVFPGEPVPPLAPEILQVDTFQYIAVADGVRSAYTNGDGLAQFQSSSILNPGTVSYFNLFINGMLQPLNTYTVTEGLLQIDGVPEQGVPITLQFISIISRPAG